MSKAKLLPQYIAASTICIGAWGTGTVLGWTSNITDDLRNGKLNGLKMGNYELGWTGSCCTLGAMMMSFPVGFVADWIGRRPTCLATVVPFTVGWLLIIFSRHVVMVYVGRILTGAAGGALVVVAPVYATEIAQTHIRGTLGIFVQLFLVLGVLHGNVLGWALPMMAFNMACMAVPLIFGALFFFQPETPLFDLKHGRIEKAESSFKRLRGEDYDCNEEIAIILKEMEDDNNRDTFWNAMKTKANKKATFISITLLVFKQLTGVTAMSFYSKDIFIKSDTGVPEHLGVIGTGITGFFAVIVSVLVIDSYGRTLLLKISSGMCAFSTALLAFYFTLKHYQKITEHNKFFLNIIPVFSMMFFYVAFNIGMGPIPWLAASELCSPEVKAIIGSVACTLNWFAAFLVTNYCLTLQHSIGTDNTFYIFTAITLHCILFIYLFVPETMNKRYEEIKMELEKVR